MLPRYNVPMLASSVALRAFAYVWNAPRLALVLTLPRYNKPMFASSVEKFTIRNSLVIAASNCDT